MKICQLLAAFLFAVSLNAQAPAITSVQNPASNILPGLPNYGIAQGQIFVLYGTNMGPATIVQPTSLPLPVLLGGTSVKITGIGSGTVYNAPLIYALNTQVAAVMPSGVPLGLGATIQVTYNGTVGNVFSTRVVDSNFGISTVDQSGGGTAVITDANYTVITAANSAQPGVTYTMWGTGLGAANSDNNIATNGDLGTNIQVFVGGVAATVTYRGRSGGPGLDQINFTIPPGVTGCNVSLMIQTNTAAVRVSNAPTLSIAQGGGACSDANAVPQAAELSALASKGSTALGYVSLDPTKSQALAFFLQFNAAQWAAVTPKFQVNSLGSCTTSVGAGNQSDGPPASTGLDAGSTMTLTPPGGGAALSLPFVQTGVYQAKLSATSTGVYTVSNGAGGVGVGKFSVSFNGPPSFTWTNSNATTVTKSAGFQVTWAGGDSNSVVNIQGSAPSTPVTVNGNILQTNTSVSFLCQVPANTGSFTIPAQVLLAMPTTPVAGTPNGTITVALSTNPQVITIPGVDAGIAQTVTAPVTGAVIFQ